jgi:hypothetical protein
LDFAEFYRRSADGCLRAVNAQGLVGLRDHFLKKA